MNDKTNETQKIQRNHSGHYDPAVTMPLLFPEPLNERFYLWVHQYEETEPGKWQHPGVLPADDPILTEQGFYTTAQAVESSREMDRIHLMMINSGLSGPSCISKTILWRQAAYYHWLCAHGAGPQNALAHWDGEGICVATDDVDEWAKGRLPE